MLALLAALVCSEAIHPAAPARVSSLDGAAVIREVSGVRDLALNEPLTSGVTLETSAGTLLEIEIAGGTFVRIGGGSAIHLDQLGLDTEVTLLSGALAADPGPRARTFVFGARGERLLEGHGVVESGAREDPTRFLSWSDVRDRDAAGTLRDALVGEWELERNGEWLVVDGRRAWRPRVDPSWRPYRDGEWRDLSWGWTWLPDETWGFVTVHQGRWIRHRALGWIWFRSDGWSPAWVTWDSRAGATLAWAPCSPAHIEFRPDPTIWIGADFAGSNPAPVRLYRDGHLESPQPGGGRHNDNGRGTDDGDGTRHHGGRGDNDGGRGNENGDGTDGGRGGRGNDDSGTGSDGEDDGEDDGEQSGGRGDDDDDSGTGGDDDDDGEQGGGRGHDDNGHGNDDDHDDDSNPGQGGGGHGTGNNGGGTRHRDGWTTRAPAAVAREGWTLSNRAPAPGRETGANRAPLGDVRPFAESSRAASRSDAPPRSQFATPRSPASARFLASTRTQQAARPPLAAPRDPRGPPRSQFAAPQGRAPARSQVAAPRASQAPARSQGSRPSRAPSNQNSSHRRR